MSVHRGASAYEEGLPLGGSALESLPPGGGLPNPPLLTSSGGHYIGRYVLYRNAFLFWSIFLLCFTMCGMFVCNTTREEASPGTMKKIAP